MKNQTKSKVITAVALIALLLPLSGCANMSPTEQRVISGAVIGGTAGAVGYAVTGGCVSCGAAIGAVVGAGTGYVVDQFNR